MSLPVVSGPVIRGALLATLLSRFCPVRGDPACGTAVLAASCPICPLLATPDETAGRPGYGTGTPRPFTVEPPLEGHRMLPAGEALEFGLTIFGDPLPLLPYLLLGALHMGTRGLGDRRRAPGLFALRAVYETDPLQGTQRRIMSSAEERIAMPALPITHQGVLQHARHLPCDAVVLELLTPLRVVSDGRLVYALSFDVLLRRLLRRIDQLSHATTGRGLALPFTDLVAAAQSIRVARDETRWLDVSSYSHRTGRSMPIGGLVGRVTFAGDLSPFLPWLVWGEITHAGKDATKGNGWYRLTRVSSAQRV